MNEIKNKQVFLLIGANFLGLPTEGLTVIPAIVYQQHGDKVHCTVTKRGSDKELLVTVDETDIHHNIKDVISAINNNLLKTTNELDK